eukprot:TRINITY_DN11553_c0_g1_i1.p1 TRINITY_DN11553_c0_g1~~TRINITY_DN11553_c0_g1_i1.p1  ORF type:complete len:386 (+),score=118.08 TRINITY_DN11553_c0_g1_i1:70-1158(+)
MCIRDRFNTADKAAAQFAVAGLAKYTLDQMASIYVTILFRESPDIKDYNLKLVNGQLLPVLEKVPDTPMDLGILTSLLDVIIRHPRHLDDEQLNSFTNVLVNKVLPSKSLDATRKNDLAYIFLKALRILRNTETGNKERRAVILERLHTGLLQNMQILSQTTSPFLDVVVFDEDYSFLVRPMRSNLELDEVHNAPMPGGKDRVDRARIAVTLPAEVITDLRIYKNDVAAITGDMPAWVIPGSLGEIKTAVGFSRIVYANNSQAIEFPKTERPVVYVLPKLKVGHNQVEKGRKHVCVWVDEKAKTTRHKGCRLAEELYESYVCECQLVGTVAVQSRTLESLLSGFKLLPAVSAIIIAVWTLFI